MKISVLIPTRDRLTLLRSAVDSVLRLDDEDCELVISDNASSENVAEYVESLSDPRVVYTGTNHPLAVTENWNNALEHSSGDYVIMLGDDDALLSTYFSRTRKLIAEFDRPQVVYHNALVYAYPGVVPDEPDGYLRSEGYADFLLDARHPFRLERERATSMAHAAMSFRVRYGFNMQFVTVERGMVQELTRNGSFYRSPFPDYYAMNHLFLRARSIVVDPHPMVVIGVSPRSYGFFHNNQQETAGRSLLEGGDDAALPDPSAAAPLLPGTNINDGWLGAMRELHLEARESREPAAGLPPLPNAPDRIRVRRAFPAGLDRLVTARRAAEAHDAARARALRHRLLAPAGAREDRAGEHPRRDPPRAAARAAAVPRVGPRSR